MNEPTNYLEALRRIDDELGRLRFRGRYPLRDLDLLYAVEEIVAYNWQNNNDLEERRRTADEAFVRLLEAGLALDSREDFRYDEEAAEELLREIGEDGR